MTKNSVDRYYHWAPMCGLFGTVVGMVHAWVVVVRSVEQPVPSALIPSMVTALAATFVAISVWAILQPRRGDRQ